MALWQLFNLITEKRLIVSPTSPDSFTLPILNDTNQQSIAYQALIPNATGGIKNPYSIMGTGTYTVAVGLFDASRNQLSFQNAFVADPTSLLYTGILPLDTAAINTLLTLPTISAPATFEIRVTETTGSIYTAYAQPVVLQKAFITSV